MGKIKSKSRLMRAYNFAKIDSKTNERIDSGRLNRALGLALSKTTRPYNTDWYECDCPDAKRHPELICKHRLALMLEYHARFHTPGRPINSKFAYEFLHHLDDRIPKELRGKLHYNDA